MKKKVFFKLTCIVILVSLIGQGCAIVEPNELGLKVRLGVLSNDVLLPGPHGYNPFTAKIIKYNCRLLKLSEKNDYSTNDGLEVNARVNLLYHIDKDSLKAIDINLGRDYEEKYVGTLFRSVVREEVVLYNAKDIIDKIQNLEDNIALTLKPLLAQYGFIIDKIIVNDLHLPDEVNSAIKAKVRAEQLLKQREVENDIDRQNVVYQAEKEKLESNSRLELAKLETKIILEKQKAESQRLIMESHSLKQSQAVIDSTLTPKQLELKKINAIEKLAGSPNSKLIINDGKSIMMFSDDVKK